MLVLATVMVGGVVGVLLFNTAMQQQSVRLRAQQAVVSRLQVRAQALQTAILQAADPAALAERARTLHMRPATQVRWERRRSARKRGSVPGTGSRRRRIAAARVTPAPSG